MMISDPWASLLNQSGGGSIDMSRGFSGFGNLPPLDWMPNPGAEHGVDDRGQFSWNAADPYTYFRWYESLQFARAREEDRRLLLGDSAKTSRMLLAGKFSENQDTSAAPRWYVNGVEYELRDFGGLKVWLPCSQGWQPTAPPRSMPDWLEQFAPTSPLDPTASPPPAPAATSPTSSPFETPPARDARGQDLQGLLSWAPLSAPSAAATLPPAGGRQQFIASLTEEMLYRDLKESGYSAAALNRLNKHYEAQFPLSKGNLQELLLKRSAAFATAYGGQWRRGDYLYAIHNLEVGLVDLAGATIAGGSWRETAENLVKGILIGGALGAAFGALRGSGSSAASGAAGDTGGTLKPQLKSALPPASSISLPPEPASPGLLQMSDRAIAQHHLFNVNAANVLDNVPFLRTAWRRDLGKLNQQGLVRSLENNPATKDLYFGIDQPPGTSVPDLLHTGSGTGKPFLEVTSMNQATVAAHRGRWYWEYSDPLLYPNAPSGWNIWQAPGGRLLRIWVE